MQIVKWQMFSLFPSCLSGMYFDIFAKARIFLLPFDNIEKNDFQILIHGLLLYLIVLQIRHY